MTRVGHVREIVRYPVKSMAGVPTESAVLGWHGLAGDRRFAFRRIGDASGFPWLSASRLPELILYHPCDFDERAGEPLATRVRAPSGSHHALGSAGLNSEIGARCGSDVELMKLKHGIFDETAVSVIALATIAGIGREAGLDLDRRRFRANVFLETEGGEPFLEDRWVGGVLAFGDGDSAPAVSVVMRDERCMMINLDPDTAKQDGRPQRAVVRLNGNSAGVYATVVRTGTIRVGDPVEFTSS
jgi:hypothetical protein